LSLFTAWLLYKFLSICSQTYPADFGFHEVCAAIPRFWFLLFLDLTSLELMSPHWYQWYQGLSLCLCLSLSLNSQKQKQPTKQTIMTKQAELEPYDCLIKKYSLNFISVLGTVRSVG
jgi:uncharacterized protein (DUF2237 family)